MEYHGMIINLLENKAIVSTSTFECYYIKRSPRMHIGKHIEFSEKEIIKGRSPIKLLLGVACIAIVCVIALASLTNMKSLFFGTEVFAYVDVDINPSLEFAIDDMSNVLSVEPLNEDAKVLVKKIKLNKVTLFHAMNVITDELKKNKVISESGKDYVLISSTLNSEKDESSKEYQSGRIKLDNIVNSLGNNIKDKENGKVNVFLMQTTLQERTAARSNHISSGRYVLYKRSKDLGNSYSIEEAKTININELLKGILDNTEEKGSPSQGGATHNPSATMTPFISTPVPTPSPVGTTNIILNSPSTPFGKPNSPAPIYTLAPEHSSESNVTSPSISLTPLQPISQYTPLSTSSIPTSVPLPVIISVPTPAPISSSTPVPIPAATTPVPTHVSISEPISGPVPVSTPAPTPVPIPVLISTPAPTPSQVPTSTHTLPPTPVPTSTPTPTPNINSSFVKLESYNYRGYYILHQQFNGLISNKVNIAEDALFKMVPGLADSACVSLESKNFPGYYLMHENFKIVLKKYDGSASFKECATFRKVPGISDNSNVSFQSYNYPKRYIRHRVFSLYAEEIVTELEKKDATYIEIKD